MKDIKRKVVYAILIVVCFLLNSMLFPHLTIASVQPNLILILIAAIGFMRGKTEGLVVGFCAGLLVDVFNNNLLGIHALLYMLIGYGNGFFKHVFYDEDIKLPLGLITASEVIYGIFIYIFYFMLKGDFRFLYYLRHIIIPETLYTIMVTLVLYRIILHFNQKLEEEEQKGASKFV